MSWRNLDTQSTLQTFASMTGGRAYYNSNDLVKGFRDAVNDSAEYYNAWVLSRSVEDQVWLAQDRGKSKTRARGSAVRASGFFVTNVNRRSREQPHSDIASALQSPLDYTSLALVARWDQDRTWQRAGQKNM